MVTLLLCIAAALWIPGLVILVVSMRRAPRGFEDAEGFHVVPEPNRSTEPVHGATVHPH